MLTDSGHTGPVPVLFSLSEWNPSSTELRSWLGQQLVRDFPFLEGRDPATGTRMADALVNNELILPVLNGFDEIPTRYHRDAINKISKVDWPLIVTSRSAEYTQAAQAVNAVGRAAAIEIEDLSLDEAHRYLRLSTAPADRTLTLASEALPRGRPTSGTYCEKRARSTNSATPDSETTSPTMTEPKPNSAD